MMNSPDKLKNQSGLSILEVLISMSISIGILVIFSTAVVDSMDFSVHNVGRADLHEIARRSMEVMRKDISRTGWFTIDANSTLPFVFADGDPQVAMFDGFFKHDQAVLAAMNASFTQAPPPPPPGGGATPVFVAPAQQLAPTGLREFIFWVPAKDAEGNFTFDATGKLAMAPELIAFLLIPNAEGTLDLVRRRANFGVWPPTIDDSTICNHVEALTFDTVATRPNLPFDAVEIHLHMKRKGSRGEMQRLHTAITVMMRNSSS